MPNYSFRCESGHEVDAVRPVACSSIPCHCGRDAVRLSVYRTVQVTPEARYHGRDFIEASEMLESRRAEYEKREGVPTAMPDFAGAAQRRAESLKRAGATIRDI